MLLEFSHAYAFGLDGPAKVRLGDAVKRVVENTHWTRTVGRFARTQPPGTGRETEDDFMANHPTECMALRIRLLPGILLCLKEKDVMGSLYSVWNRQQKSVLHQFRLFLYSWAFNQSDQYDNPNIELFSELVPLLVLELTAADDFRGITRTDIQNLYSIRLCKMMNKYSSEEFGPGLDTNNSRRPSTEDFAPAPVHGAKLAELFPRTLLLDDYTAASDEDSQPLLHAPNSGPSHIKLGRKCFDDPFAVSESESLADEETLPEKDVLRLMNRPPIGQVTMEKPPYRSGREPPVGFPDNGEDKNQILEHAPLSRELTLHRPDEIRAAIIRGQQPISKDFTFVESASSFEARTASTSHRIKSLDSRVEMQQPATSACFKREASPSPIPVSRQGFPDPHHTRLLSRFQDYHLATPVNTETDEVIQHIVRVPPPLKPSVLKTEAAACGESERAIRNSTVPWNVRNCSVDNPDLEGLSAETHEIYQNVAHNHSLTRENDLSAMKELGSALTSEGKLLSELNTSDLFLHKLEKRYRVDMAPTDLHAKEASMPFSGSGLVNSMGSETISRYQTEDFLGFCHKRSQSNDFDVFQQKLDQSRNHEISSKDTKNDLTRFSDIHPANVMLSMQRIERDEISRPLRETIHQTQDFSMSKKETENDDLFPSKMNSSFQKLGDLHHLEPSPKPLYTESTASKQSRELFTRPKSGILFRRTRHDLQDSGLNRVQRILFHSDPNSNSSQTSPMSSNSPSDDLDLFRDKMKILRSGESGDHQRSSPGRPLSNSTNTSYRDDDVLNSDLRASSRSSERVTPNMSTKLSSGQPPECEPFPLKSGDDANLNREITIKNILDHPSTLNNTAHDARYTQTHNTTFPRKTATLERNCEPDQHNDVIARIGVEAITSNSSASLPVAGVHLDASQHVMSDAHSGGQMSGPSFEDELPFSDQTRTLTRSIGMPKFHDLLFHPEAAVVMEMPKLMDLQPSHTDLSLLSRAGPNDSPRNALEKSLGHQHSSNSALQKQRDQSNHENVQLDKTPSLRSSFAGRGISVLKHAERPFASDGGPLKKEEMSRDLSCLIADSKPREVGPKGYVARNFTNDARIPHEPWSPPGEESNSTSLLANHASSAASDSTKICNNSATQQSHPNDNEFQHKGVVITEISKKRARLYEPPIKDELNSPDIFEHRMKKPRLAARAPTPSPDQTNGVSDLPTRKSRTNSDDDSDIGKPLIRKGGAILPTQRETYNLNTLHDELDGRISVSAGFRDVQKIDSKALEPATNHFLRRSHRVSVPRQLTRCVEEWTLWPNRPK